LHTGYSEAVSEVISEGFGEVALEEGGSWGAVPVVHAVAKAVFPVLAGGAVPFPGPGAVPECLEAGFPNLIEVVLVDVSLGEGVAVYVGAGADASVYKDGGDVDACAAEEACSTDLLFVSAKIAFATEGDFHGAAQAAPFLYEFHQGDELVVGQDHFRIICRAAYGNDGEKAPLPDSKGGQDIVYLREFGKIALVDAGHDVKVQAGLGGGY
jgi:hypothetical protein